jgi:hypothetical protein
MAFPTISDVPSAWPCYLPLSNRPLHTPTQRPVSQASSPLPLTPQTPHNWHPCRRLILPSHLLHAGLLLGRFSTLKMDTIRHVGSRTDYTELSPRRWEHS